MALFVGLCGMILTAVFAGVQMSARRAGVPPRSRLLPFALGVVLWLGAISFVVQSGVIAAEPMPRIVILFGLINVVSLAVGLSRVGGWLAMSVPIAWLVAFQGFRLPLELLLHQWAMEGTIPETMTWTGRNWDIVTGIVALVAAPWAARSRAVAWTANVVGIVLLLNVARVAMMSSPLPFAWGVTPPLQIILHLPYAWIGPVCVGGAVFGHVVLTRALLRKR